MAAHFTGKQTVSSTERSGVALNPHHLGFFLSRECASGTVAPAADSEPVHLGSQRLEGVNRRVAPYRVPPTNTGRIAPAS